MRYNQLGNSSLVVSELGFGTMSLDIDDKKHATDLIRHAFDCGVNYFDTADLYSFGDNEKLLGDAVKCFRKDVILATKVGNRWHEDRTGWDWDLSSAYIKEAVEKSLRRLGTDYIDLYQLHGGTQQDDFEEVQAVLEDLVAEGKIRYYGISSIRPNVFTHYCEHANIVSNMMQFSVLDQRPKDYFSVFEKSKVSVLARGTLAQGLLLGKSAEPYLNLDSALVRNVQDYLIRWSEDTGVSLCALPIGYVLSFPVVASALMGVRNLKQFNELMEGYHAIDQLDFARTIFNDINNHYTDHLI